MPTQQDEVIRLDWEDDDRRVVVSPKDRDRFMMTCQQAAEACKRGHQAIAWQQQFVNMLSFVRQWIAAAEDSIDACYVAFRDAQQILFVVPKSGRFDFDLDERLTVLDIDIASQFPECNCEIQQIPCNSKETLATFLDPTVAIQLYGD